MGISIKDAFFIEIDTYFELVDMFYMSHGGNEKRSATQADIDNFLM